MILKKMLLIIGLCSFVYSSDFNKKDFQNLNNIHMDVSEFNVFDKEPKINDFKDLNDGTLSEGDIRMYLDSFYKGNNFMTKDEVTEITNELFSLKNKMKTSAHTFLFYFTTEDVPLHSIANTLLQLSILQDNNVGISSKVYMMGPTDDFKEYLFKTRNYIENYPIKYQDKIANNFKLKFGPDFFEAYKINKAPALAIAYCSAAIPSVDKCHIPYIIRGDVSLEYFFKRISQHDKKYTEFSDLIKNNMMNYQINNKDML